MPIKNYTTSVNMHRTVAEIQGILAQKGARSVQVLYDEGGNPQAVQFAVLLNGIPIPFRLPCNVEGVFRALQKARKTPSWRRDMLAQKRDREQAPHVAWRIVKDWVEAQMALVEAEQAQLAEVFLPYAVNDNGQTVFEYFLETKLKALPAPSENPLESVNG